MWQNPSFSSSALLFFHIVTSSGWCLYDLFRSYLLTVIKGEVPQGVSSTFMLHADILGSSIKQNHLHGRACDCPSNPHDVSLDLAAD